MKETQRIFPKTKVFRRRQPSGGGVIFPYFKNILKAKTRMWDCGSSSAHAQPPPPAHTKWRRWRSWKSRAPPWAHKMAAAGLGEGGGLRDPPTIPSPFTKKPRIFPLFVVLEADFPFFGSFRRGILLTEAAEAHPGAALCPPPPPFRKHFLLKKKNQNRH